ncbi:MAG: selenocysteine-specific translation elongation factor [Planctomycetes bacterium]|nr:selenocysteine-specific translation elongation factor [Planctomycetota bacterium]
MGQIGLMSIQQHNVTLGTAGHIDHGKTALVKLLTGCDTDRLKIEKERGMSIELGFAPCVIADIEVGLVDVPGHENFVKTMVAGASGIDGCIFVVAADDGVMPQTREHMDILTLLGVEHGIVALTKVDAVPPERTEAATQEVRRFLAGTFLQDAPILPISNITGQGFEEFYEALKTLVAGITPKTAEGVFRLPVERAFSAKGYGTIVAGIPASGSIGIGDELVLLPQGTKGRLRSVQVYGRDSTRALAGQCAALNVPQWDPKDVERGNVVTLSDYFAPHQWYLCELKLLDQEKGDLKNGAQVKFHTGTSETPASVYLFGTPPSGESEGLPFGVPPSGGFEGLPAQPAPSSANAEGKAEVGLSDPRKRGTPNAPPKGGTPNSSLKPGGRCLVQIFLDHPVVAGPRDHFILRSLSPVRTLGGGMIVEALERRLKRTHPEILAEIAARAKAVARPREFVEYCVKTADSFAAEEKQISLRSKIPPKELAALLTGLVDDKRILPISGKTYLHVDTAEQVRQHLAGVVREFHHKRPESPGISRELLLTESARGEAPVSRASRPRVPRASGPRFEGETPSTHAGKMPATHAPLRKDVFEASVAQMLSEGKLVERKGFLALPEHREQFNNAEQQLLQYVEALFRKHLFDPPGPQEIADQMRVPPPQVQRALRILTEQKQLVRVDQDLLFHAEAVVLAKERLVAHIQQNGGLESVKFKYLLDTSRKYAIPLLDYFDKIGVTRRVGYTRHLK